MFKERIVDLRKRRKLSQQELAKAIGISREALSGYEQGRREPSLDTLEKLADYFGVSLDYLFGRTDLATPPPELDIPLEYVEVVKGWQQDGMSAQEIKDWWNRIKEIALKIKELENKK